VVCILVGISILPLFMILIFDFGIVPSVCHSIYQMEYLVLCACFVDRCLSLCTFSVGHCAFCSSSIYGFGLPLCYLQTLLFKRAFQYELNIFITLRQYQKQ